MLLFEWVVEDLSKNHPVTATYIGSDTVTGCSYTTLADSTATFGHLRHYTWNRVIRWLRNKHRKSGWKALRRRYGPTGWWPRDGETTLFDPASVTVTRYRYRGVIPPRWAALAQIA